MTDKNILLTLEGKMGRGSTWEKEWEQKMSFGGKSQIIRLTEEDVDWLYQKLSERNTSSLKKDIPTCLKLEMENCMIKVYTNP